MSAAFVTMVAGGWAPVLIAMASIGIAVAALATADRAHAIADAAAVRRIAAAAEGDLFSPVPPRLHQQSPELADALTVMIRQFRANLDSVNTLAMFDPVTSLPNRMQFRRDAEQLLAGLDDDAAAVLMFIDLDNFKSVNDTLGHAHGDQLLAAIGGRLRAVTRSGPDQRADDLAGRLAGDEFTLLFRVDDPGDAEALARRVFDAVSQPLELAGQPLQIGCSIGIALRPDHGRTLSTLMRAADVAMYRAKNMGRGRYRFFDEELAEQLIARTRLERDLRLAVERGEFAFAFQPQIALADNRVVAGEALLRWHHPEDGVQLPASFLTAAEDSGLMSDIGAWSLQAIGESLARRARRGSSHRLSFNLNARQIAGADFFGKLRTVLRQHDAPIRLLELEFPEATLMERGELLLRDLAAIRAEGATITIDAFGAGMSDLSRLRTLPVDRIKLDRSLVEGLGRSGRAREVTQAVIGLIHGLGAEAVATGIETLDQLDVLRVMGCDAGQGYAIAPPLDDEAFRDWDQDARSQARASGGSASSRILA